MGVIVVVLPKLENAKKVKKILLEHGFQTVFACSSASRLFRWLVNIRMVLSSAGTGCRICIIWIW